MLPGVQDVSMENNQHKRITSCTRLRNSAVLFLHTYKCSGLKIETEAYCTYLTDSEKSPGVLSLSLMRNAPSWGCWLSISSAFARVIRPRYHLKQKMKITLKCKAQAQNGLHSVLMCTKSVRIKHSYIDGSGHGLTNQQSQFYVLKNRGGWPFLHG